jgi:hypothetical protein
MQLLYVTAIFYLVSKLKLKYFQIELFHVIDTVLLVLEMHDSSTILLLQLPHPQTIYCILLSIKSKYGILTLLYMKLSNSNKLRSIITYLHLLHANQNRLNNLTRIRLTLRKSTNQNTKTYTL